MNKKQIEQQLKESGIKFKHADSKEELEKLLNSQIKSYFPEENPEKELTLPPNDQNDSPAGSVVEPVASTVREIPSTVVEINGKSYRKYFHPDGTTTVELIR